VHPYIGNDKHVLKMTYLPFFTQGKVEDVAVQVFTLATEVQGSHTINRKTHTWSNIDQTGSEPQSSWYQR
jgi:hypothetical protein